MKAFFKIQLKLFYRQISYYISAIVLSLINVVIAFSLYISLKVADPSGKFVQSTEASSMYRSFMVVFGTVSGFMTSAFAMQNLFYKYKEEGLFYVMQSKPITKREIFVATIFAGIIVLASQIGINSIGYFIGTFFIPALPLKHKFLSWLVFFAASFLISLVSMSIGAIGNNFVQAKSYQFVAGWIPGIFVLISFFISTPGRTKANLVQPIAVAKNAYIVKQKKSDEEDLKNIKFIANPLNVNKFSFLIDNTFSQKEDFRTTIDKTRRNFYHKVFWMDLSSYFSAITFTVNRRDGITNEFMYTKDFIYNEEKFQSDLKEGKFVFKIVDDTLNSTQQKVNYFAMVYSPVIVSNISKKVKSADSTIEQWADVFKETNKNAVTEKREKGFLDLRNNLIQQLDNLYETKNGVFDNVIPVLSLGTFPLLYQAIGNDKDVFEIIKNYTIDRVEFTQEEYSKENLKKLTQKEINSLKENPIFTNFVLKYNLIKQTTMTYLFLKLIKDKSASVLHNFNADALKSQLKTLNSFTGLKIVSLDRDTILEYSTEPAIKWYSAIIALILLAAFLSIIGGIIYVKKNN
ncbi:ABC transporter permease [Metamycoplasma hyosynoviae]|nr:ABC transporter permease [Metamycoplasma hyosynoviae]MDD7896549.1 ABC transporter permease [Metamycoplasma hyosynoviae]